jgi:hypothetical protein
MVIVMGTVRTTGGLDQYLSAADETASEILQSDNKVAKALWQFDNYFQAELLPQVSTTSIFGTLLLLNAYQLFLAAVRTGLSGHTAAIFPLLRASLESAAYGFLLVEKPELSSVWTNRHASETDKKACRSAFTFEKAIAGIGAKSPDIHKLAKQAYESTIDYGAHPNVRGVFGHVSLDENRPDGMAAVSHVSLYDADHIETVRGLCAALDIGFLVIAIIVLSGGDVTSGMEADLQSLSDLKNAAIAEYEVLED